VLHRLRDVMEFETLEALSGKVLEDEVQARAYFAASRHFAING